MKYLLIVIFILLVPQNTMALKQPLEYGINQCELIAKDYQNIYGGSLVWIQPLKDNGAYDLGEYNAHIINRVYIYNEGIIYIDYQSGFSGHNLSDVGNWYEVYSGNNAFMIFELYKERPPFPMWWHY